MKFIMGENFLNQLERASYRGGVGLYYNDTLGGVLTFVIINVVLVLALIGLFSLLKFVFFGRRKKEDPGKKWLRTGKF